MKRTHPLCLLALLVGLVAHGSLALAAETMPAALSTRVHAGGALLAQAYVPEPSRRVGEVRLLRRGATRIAQTLLYTKLLKRVVAEISNKERRNWLPGDAAYGASELYLSALATAAASLERPKVADRTGDRRRRLLIEFVYDDSVAAVVFSRFESREESGVIVITQRQPITWLELDRAYVARNIDLIAGDAVHLDAKAIAELWQQPAASEP